MGKFVRKTREERMLEIRSSALDLFISKGYTATTMDDIVSSVDMSKGSVYRYYPQKQEILIDLLKDGMMLRNTMIKEYMVNKQFSDEVLSELLAEILYSEKASGKYAKLYIIFLYEKMFDKNLEAVYQSVVNYGMETTDYIDEIDSKKILPITTMMNMLILSKFIMDKEFKHSITKTRMKELFLMMLKGETDEKK